MNANNRLEIFLALNAKAFKKSLSTAESGLRQFTRSVSTAFGQLATVVAPITAVVSATAGLTKIVGVTRDFDALSAGLITATGSAEGAKEAFDALAGFASRTPYDLAQVTDGFVKLVNFGLNPSQEAMTSYGNTASAMRKSLNQMIEAVADAATGEFERLKEFGIKSKTEGDKVSFTFRGITETVGKNAGDIEKYLIGLGETNFGDAMLNRMNSLDGDLSNLGDEWEKLFLNISRAGIGDAIADGVRVAIDALENLNAMIVSGEIEGYLNAYAGKWSAWAEDVKKSIGAVSQYFTGEMDGVQTRGGDTVAFLVDAFRNFPENVRAFIGLLTVEVASGFDRLKVDARAFKDSIKAIFSSSTLDEVESERLRQLEIIRLAKVESIAAIIKERDTAVNSAEAQIAAAKKLRAEYEKNREAEKADPTDRTAKFKVKNDDDTTKDDLTQDRDFSEKSTSRFVEKNGEWVEVPGDAKDTGKAKAARERLEKEEKEAAEKSIEIAENTARAKQDIDKKAAAQGTAVPSRLARERLGPQKKPEGLETEDSATIPADTPDDEEAERRLQAREEQAARNRQYAEEERQQDQERKKTALQSAEDIAKANGERIEAARQGAVEWAQAEAQAVEKAKSVFQRYADKVRSLQDEISGRERSLAEEMDSIDTKGTEESRWRKRAKDARDYEKAAKQAMEAGDLESALSLSDRAREAYSSLKGGAGSVSDTRGDQAAFRGVQSAGALGIDIAKAIQQATAKTAMTSMSGGSMFGDLSSRIRGQLAALASGNQEQAAGKGAAPVEKIHELKFAGGSMRGAEADVEALLNLLAQAGMSA